MAEINTGDMVRFSAAFLSSAGVAADPTAVSLTLNVNGTATTYTYAGTQVVKDSVGNYHYDYTIPTAASFYEVIYRWAGTGAVTASEEGYFFAVSML